MFRSTHILLFLPILTAVCLLLYSLIDIDTLEVNRLIRASKVGLDPVRTTYVESWVESLSGVVGEEIVLNPQEIDGKLAILTEREAGDVFKSDVDAVYLPAPHAIIISRGLVDLGTNCVGRDEFTEDVLANAEDTEGYQLFMFVLLHELGHSKLHNGKKGFFGIKRSCHRRTRIEQEADEFAASNVLNAPYGYIIWYGQPESTFESEDAYAIAKFQKLLRSKWREVELPDRYGESNVNRNQHLEAYFSKLAEQLENHHALR